MTIINLTGNWHGTYEIIQPTPCKLTDTFTIKLTDDNKSIAGYFTDSYVTNLPVTGSFDGKQIKLTIKNNAVTLIRVQGTVASSSSLIGTFEKYNSCVKNVDSTGIFSASLY